MPRSTFVLKALGLDCLKKKTKKNSKNKTNKKQKQKKKNNNKKQTTYIRLNAGYKVCACWPRYLLFAYALRLIEK